MKKCWQFQAGARAGFGHEKFNEEYHELYPSYRAGYDWAKNKVRIAQENKHIKSIGKE
jgi:hypothetical protein